MKKNLFGLILAVFMMFALAMNAGGEEAKPEAKGEAKPGAKPAISLEEIKNLLGLSIYLQGGYTFNFNNPYAHEEKDPLNGGKDSEWYGVAGYVKYDFTDFFSTSIRAEYFNDENGVRTGIAQELKEVTLTAGFKIAKNLLVRPEYRHDWSTQNGFDSEHNTLDTKNQDTIAVGVMYTW